VKKVAIVCGAPASEMEAPFEDKSYEIWVLGNRVGNFKGKRFTRIFEIHDKPGGQAEKDPDRYWGALLSLGKPLIVGAGFPHKHKLAKKFPFDKAREMFGETYLTSTPAFMIALALLEGFDHIAIYGVDMHVDDSEYFWQRPCLEAWIGFAKGRGVDVYIHPSSPVLKSHYIEGSGCGGKPDFSKPPFTQGNLEAMVKQHSEKVTELEREKRKLEDRIIAHDAARQTCQRLVRVARAVESGQEVHDLVSTATLI